MEFYPRKMEEKRKYSNYIILTNKKKNVYPGVVFFLSLSMLHAGCKKAFIAWTITHGGESMGAWGIN